MEQLDNLRDSLLDIWESKERWKVFLAAAVVVLAVLGAAILFFSGPSIGSLTVLVKNPEGEAMWKASVRLAGIEGDFSAITDRRGAAVFTGVPAGKDFTVEVSGKGFKKSKTAYKIAGEKNSVSVTLEPDGDSVALLKTITFVGPDGAKLENRLLTAQLSCSSGMSLSSPSRQVSGGQIEVEVPSGCGAMMATVSGTGFGTGTFNLNESSIITLSAIQAETGRATVVVKDSSGNFIDGIMVSVTDSRGMPIGQTQFTGFGEAVFQLEPGSYTARASGNSTQYNSAEAPFAIEARGSARVDIVLSEKPVATINVRIVDNASKAEIKNAKAILEDADGRKTATAYAGGTLKLGLARSGTYKLGAVAEGYSASGSVQISTASVQQQPYVIELAKCTPGTCGLLTISVVDEDNAPVANARVGLKDSVTGFFAEEYGLKYTDVRGNAKFSGVKTGRYVALVQKYPAEGGSQPFDANTGVDSTQKVSLTIGDGTIQVSAVDEDNGPIPFGFAEFRSEGRDKLGKIPLDREGKAAFTTKADKKVFVTVSAGGYTNYTSSGMQIYPQKTVSVVAGLRKEILGDTPSIQFTGLYTETGAKTETMAAGNTYIARFLVNVPESLVGEMEQLGVFVRAGDDRLVEKEPFYINSIDAPMASVLKGSTYNEPMGDAIDGGNLTNGEAKWASAVWDKAEIRHGTYVAGVELHVRESTTPGAAMPLYYRAFAVNEEGGVLRDPFDGELGAAEEVSGKQGMYAKPYEKGFAEGAIEQCDEDFCYSERVLDLKNGLYLTPPYNLRIFGSYQFEFSITNNSQSVHNSADLRVKNSLNGVTADKALKISSYSITNADARVFRSSAGAYELQPIALGNFRQNKEIRGTLQLKPEVLGMAALDMRIVSDRQQVFLKQVFASAVNEKDMNVTVRPTTMPALTEFDLNVEARLYNSADDFTEVEGASVRVERTTPDRQRSVYTAVTGGDGAAQITMPASPPNTVIKIRVEKEGYAGQALSFKVSKNIIAFSPVPIKSGLDLTSNTQQKVQLSATNLIPETLTVSGIGFRGDFKGLLDTQQMNNWVQQYAGKAQLQYQAASQFTLLTAISEDARRLGSPEKLLGGTLYFEVATQDRQVKWPSEVPALISISLAEPPKEPNCLEISIKEWKDATLGGTAVAEFYIRNNCLSQSGKPLDLRSLKAKIKWNGNKHGNVELHATDHESGQEASEALSDGAYSTLFENVPGGREYTALLVFTPKGGTIGKKAEFTVIIDASQNTAEGEQLAGASNAIDASIDIIDLSQCIKYTPDAEAGVVLEENQGDGKLDIDSSACGNVEIDFSLCKGDKDCAGGVEGGIKASPQEFKLTSQTPKKSVKVSRQEIPGLYGIGVFVKTPGTGYRQVNTVDVLVKPAKDDAFELYKYEFSVKGKGAKDSTELTNRFFVETIGVDASICDWGDATEKGWWDWKGAGVGTVVGALASIKPAMAASHAAAAGLGKTAGGAVQAAKAAGATTGITTKLSSQEIQGLCSQINGNLAALGGISTASGAACNYVVNPHVPVAIASAQTALAAANTECQKMYTESTAAEEATQQALDRMGQISATVSGKNPVTDYSGAAYFSSGGGYVVPVAIGIAGAAVIIPKIIAHYAVKQTGISLIIAKLDAASGALTAGSVSPSPGCTAEINPVVAQIQATSTKAKSYSGGTLATGISQAGTLSTANAAAGSAVSSAGAAMTPAATASTSLLSSPYAIMGMYTLGGFFVGGMFQGLFGQDPCSQRTAGNLMDYVINMLGDAGAIDSENGKFEVEYDTASARVIGAYLKQKIGIVVTNSGVESPKPVYDTFTFNVKQHMHTNPTKISRGNSKFGPFNVPDRETQNVEAKIHVKLKTQEVEEQVPELTFDTLSCVSGNKIGRTGAGALPKIKLNWSFGQGGIGSNACLESNPSGIYCDATQFSIMLSKRLYMLKEFFDRNPSLSCPTNPLASEFSTLNADLNGQQSIAAATSCYISDWSGYLEGEPAIKQLIEANKGSITWTQDIPNAEAFLGTVHFNALLIKDGYSEDFESDFASNYTNAEFFDTPDWFDGLAADSSGRDYGIGRLFEQNKIKFTNRFFDSGQLSSAGTHEVLISVSGEGGKFGFFNADGSPNANVKVEFYLLQEPNPNSAFYSVPFDGLVGLEGDTFNRQGYGTSFRNLDSGEYVFVNNERQAFKTYGDSGSNPGTFVNAEVLRSFYSLNASPSARGNMLRLEKTSSNEAELKFSPSTATPILLKMDAGEVSQDNLAAFYRVAQNETPVDVGETLAYWDGAGACLDNAGTLITESFDTRPDRAAVSHDPVLNWESAYAVDFGAVNYTGDEYIRTVFYTDPKSDFALSAEYPQKKFSFITPDSKGLKVPLAGVTGEEFNDKKLGAAGQIKSMADVFSLVSSEKACVVDSGRKADFFWNPKAVYEMGTGTTISELTNSLKAGDTCIGLGG